MNRPAAASVPTHPVFGLPHRLCQHDLSSRDIDVRSKIGKLVMQDRQDIGNVPAISIDAQVRQLFCQINEFLPELDHLPGYFVTL
jgi:hypothetical protein